MYIPTYIKLLTVVIAYCIRTIDFEETLTPGIAVIIFMRDVFIYIYVMSRLNYKLYIIYYYRYNNALCCIF